MPIEITRESVKVSQVVAENSFQTIVDYDIIVPDTKPDVVQILVLDGNSAVVDSMISENKIDINGTLRLKILYLADEPEQSIKSIHTSTSFSYTAGMDTIDGGMDSSVQSTIDYIDYTIQNGRKISARAVITLKCSVSRETVLTPITGLSGTDDVQILREHIKVNTYLGTYSTSFVINDSLDIPAGKPSAVELLESNVSISGQECKITEGKAFIKGILGISSLYSSDDASCSLQVTEHEIPFSRILDIPGLEEGCDLIVSYELMELKFSLAEDQDGEYRLISAEIELKATAKGYAERYLEIISDAYGIVQRFRLEEAQASLDEPVAIQKSQIILKDTLVLSDGIPEISEIFTLRSKPSISACAIGAEKLEIEGAVSYQVLYLANDSSSPVHAFRQEELFKHSIDIKGLSQDMRCNVELEIEHCNYSMQSSTEIEVRLVLNVKTQITSRYSFPLIMEIDERPAEENRAASCPSVIIYFAQQGDSQWKIAKKYSTPLSELQHMNHLSEGQAVIPGQQIFITRKSTE